ncbi:hypothetical protein IFR05_015596 [Cadophora sp. M221]|nr:hypothetical protein IFR05_015596 [Cadophora sp. M221]
MALPDRYPPPSPHRPNFLPPSHSSTYPERSPRFRGPALADVDAVVRNNSQRLDSQWHDVQSHPPRWFPTEDHYESDYLSGPSSVTDASISERLEASPPPPISSNAPFYVPRSPPSMLPHPQYQPPRQDHRMDIDPGYEYDYRSQYHPSYQPSHISDQHLLPPSYLQPPLPNYEPQPRWSDRQPSPDRSRPPPQPYMHAQPSRERLVPLRVPPPPPPPPSTAGMQRNYSQGRHARAPSSSRRNPYPSADGRGRVSSGSRYQGNGGGGKRRFEKRNGYVQRGAGN